MKRNISQVVLNLVFVVIALMMILPFVLLVIASFTDEMVIIHDGYSFFPAKWSIEAYKFLWRDVDRISRAYGITVVVTVVGTVAGLAITSLLSYALSKPEMKGHKAMSFFVTFTLLFNGGLVPTYLVYTRIFGLKNTIAGLVIPGLLTNAFYVLVMRTFFRTSVPNEILESAQMDGASEFTIFFKIVIPISVPILATIGLMAMIAYWNDWYNGLIYLTNQKLFSLQVLLNRILLNAEFLANNASQAGGASAVAASYKIPMQSVRMAMAALGAIPLLCIYPFFQRYFVKGLTVGAVKG